MKNDPENVKLLNDGLVCSTNLGEILAPISQTKEHQDLFSTTVILKRKHPMNRREEVSGSWDADEYALLDPRYEVPIETLSCKGSSCHTAVSIIALP